MDSSQEKNILIRNDTQYVLSIVQKEINTINDASIHDRKLISEKLLNFITKEKPQLNQNLIQQILISFHRNFIRIAFSDKSEKLRENFCNILIFLYSNCSNIVKFFPFIFSTLTDKLECKDLEGILHLPEQMRPVISQKPHKIVKLTETCEEVRLLYIKIIEAAVLNQEYDLDSISYFIEDIVNITRTLCMDPCNTIIIEACTFAKNMSIKLKDLLLHFNVQLARGVYLAISHKQSKIRIVGLDALEKIMYCSCFKRNIEIVEDLIGFRDPNLVPIRDFYEPTTKLNYIALIVNDQSIHVRRRFYDMLSDWLLNLPDKYDLEGRFMPYIISGLFDESDDICIQVEDILDRIGKQYEFENEKEIREERQYGVDSKWVDYSIDDIWYPFPLKKRPRLGCRLILKKYVRRFIKSMCKEFDAIEDPIRKRVANLFLFSLAHIEDNCIEYLDIILLCFEKEFIRNNTKEIHEVIAKSLKLIGRYCDYESITNLIYPTLKGDLNANLADIQKSALICFKFILQGHLEILNKNSGFGIFQKKLSELFEILRNPSFLNLDNLTALELLEFLNMLINEVTNKRNYIQEMTEFNDQLDNIFDLILACLGSLTLFDANCVPTANFAIIDSKLSNINNNILMLFKEGYLKDSNLSENFSFLNSKSNLILSKIIDFVEKNSITTSSKEFRILYIILRAKTFSIQNPDQSLNQVLKIFSNIFDKSSNIYSHIESSKLLIDYLYYVEKSLFLSDYSVLFTELVFNALKHYPDVPLEKFKFSDALKDPKELEKKIKTPKSIKSEVREKVLQFLKTNFVKNPLFFNSNLETKDLIMNLAKVFGDSEILTNLQHEHEKNRGLFLDSLLLYLSKYFKFMNFEITKLKENPMMTNLENYLLEVIFDKNDEISKKSFSLLNLMVNLYPKSSFYDNISQVVSNPNPNSEIELLKVFAYIDGENETISNVFKNFKKIFNTIVEFLLDQTAKYKSVCEESFKNIVEKFPVYVVNEMIKSKSKNQFNKVKLIESLMIRFLKKK